jgi:hypothetical protein
LGHLICIQLFTSPPSIFSEKMINHFILLQIGRLGKCQSKKKRDITTFKRQTYIQIKWIFTCSCKIQIKLWLWWAGKQPNCYFLVNQLLKRISIRSNGKKSRSRVLLLKWNYFGQAKQKCFLYLIMNKQTVKKKFELSCFKSTRSILNKTLTVQVRWFISNVLMIQLFLKFCILD